uniref:DUF2309 domain-containing protein n=1 Tax=Strongyloides stercoralis TaxID=6248 RepID=A0A0K0EMN1_STRER
MKIRCYICCEKHDFDYIIIHINEMHVIRDLSLQEPLTYAVTSCLNYDVKYSDKEGSKLVHFRTFGLSLAKEAKKEGYESFIQFCVQKFKDRIVNINEKINIQLKIWCVVVTKKNTLEFNNQILEIINEFKTKALNSVILNDFFQLTTIRKKINKKSKFLLSGEQTYLLFQIFRHYLKQIGIFEDVVRKSSIIQGMIGLLNSLLNICYLLEDIKKSSDEIATCIDYCIDDFFKFLHIALPNYILSYKYHIIMHYKDWIEHFGHPIQFSTMRYESAHKCVKEA